ncbi:S-layer homology domain-containing protein [Coleofasciculus chthonoplastes]|uniref:S-layer homology domain-containing protein n=1 Tax=Coleofasciculus chthonoplastes TaxID=64178 RepID=UPI0033015B05
MSNSNLLFSLGIGVTASLAVLTPAQAQTTAFTDVSSEHWAHDYIEVLADLDIIKGFPDGTFRPGAQITRAQFAAILRQAFLATEPVSAVKFSDVPQNYWGFAAINKARAAGFLSGYPGNIFKPEQPIARVQALVSLANGLGYTSDRPEYLFYYTDADRIPDYARSSIVAATQAQLVVNYPSSAKLTPNRYASRAEVAAFVHQALVQENQIEPLSSAPYVINPAALPRMQISTIPAQGMVKSLGLSASGERLVILSPAADMIQVWETHSAERVTEIVTDGQTRFETVAISGDGTQVAAILQTLPSNALELWLWNADTGEQLWQKSLGIAQGQQRDQSGFIRVPGANLVFRPGDDAILSQVSLGVDSGQPIDAQLQLYSTATGEVLKSIGQTQWYRQIELSPDGKLLAGIPFSGEMIDIWQLDSGSRLRTFTSESDYHRFRRMVFTSNSRLNVLSTKLEPLKKPTVNPSDRVQLDTWNVLTGESVRQITDLSWVDKYHSLSRLSPDGDHYLMFSVLLPRVQMYGYEIQNPHSPIPFNVRGGYRAVFNATGDYVAVATSEGVKFFRFDL